MKKTTKGKIRRGVLYATLVLVLAVVIIAADWPTIQKAFFNPEIAREMFPEVITVSAKNTIIYTALAFTFGLILALILALMKRSDIKPYKWIATTYIELFRGLPALVTIILVGFGLPIAMGVRIPGGTLGKGTVGLGIVVAAYMAETIRAGIEAVPRGQMEAARALGMSKGAATRSIVLPQAFPHHHSATHQRVGDPHQGHFSLVRAWHHHRHEGAHQIRTGLHERHIQRNAADRHRAHVPDHHSPVDQIRSATREASSEGEVNHG